MIVKKRDGYDIIDNDRFLCRDASYSEALRTLTATGTSDREAHIAMQRETSWLEYREAWMRAVESEARNDRSP
jgi:hypothetical protein